MFKMKGVVPPMVTPFKENGDLDVSGLETIVTFLSSEVDGLFVTGSYGAGPMMNQDERRQVLEVTLEHAAGRVPVIPMVGTTNNRDSVELSRHAEASGAAAVAAVGPFYFKHNADDVLDFFRALLDAVEIPVYLYNNPGFQGYPIELEVIQQLKSEGLAGIKDATFDIVAHATYQRVLADDNFDVVLGTEAMFASAVVLGCDAFIPGLANAFPEINRQLYLEGSSGDLTACRDTQFKINRMRDIMYIARSTQLAVYAMLEIRGLLKAYPRRPFVPATAEEVASIRTELEALDYVEL